MIKYIYVLIKRLCINLIIFLYKNLNNSFRIFIIRKFGGKIGERCTIQSVFISDTTYLIEIGNDVVIAKGTNLITHEGSICIFYNNNPKPDLFGTIKIGNNCFIGMNCTLLPNTNIGNNCIIGAGSVVRSTVPDNSVVFGNPARIIMTCQTYQLLVHTNPLLYDFDVVSRKEKKRILLERVAKLKKTIKKKQEVTNY